MKVNTENMESSTENPSYLLPHVGDRGFNINDVFNMFEMVNLDKVREVCVDRINRWAVYPNQNARDRETNIRWASRWYFKKISSVLNYASNSRSKGAWGQNTTLLILFRGAFELDKRVRSDLRGRPWLRERENEYTYTAYDPDKDTRLHEWEEEFTARIVRYLCNWIAELATHVAGKPRLSFDDIKQHEQFIVVLCGALKHEKRRYTPHVRELFVNLINDMEDPESSKVFDKKYKMAFLTRIFKIAARIGDTVLLEPMERHALTPEQVRKLLVAHANDDAPEIRMEKARLFAINALSTS